MEPASVYCSPDEIERNATCLLGHVEAVMRVLQRKGFSEYAIELAVTTVYRAAMPYITGSKICLIGNRRAWVFTVAIRAAARAARREVRCKNVESAILAVPAEDDGEREAPFDICHVLSQLTNQQSQAVELCILGGKSCRDAARCMGISVGTFGRHLSAAKHRITAILAQYDPNAGRNNPERGACARAS